jgi:hypothetical protein
LSGHAKSEQILLQTGEELALARDGDRVAEVNLDVGVGTHPLPHEAATGGIIAAGTAT